MVQVIMAPETTNMPMALPFPQLALTPQGTTLDAVSIRDRYGRDGFAVVAGALAVPYRTDK